MGLTSENKLDLGKFEDWTHRATQYAMRWSKAIAKTYYGQDLKYTYYNGGSGGGFQGMGQLQRHADEYDGFLIGSPAQYWTQLQLATPWQALVIRDKLTVVGKTLTAGQVAAARSSAIAACDALDGVVDGLLVDPRVCTFSAAANLCGAPGAPASPNCLDSDQAAAVDMIWDGPRNSRGQKIWFGWDRSEPFPAIANYNFLFSSPTARWAMRDPTFDVGKVYLNATTRATAGSPAGSITYEDLATLGSNVLSDYIDNASPVLDTARDKGVKVIHIVGNYDKAIFWRQSVNYYRSVATYFGQGTADYSGLQRWYRFFIMPGVGDGTFHTNSPDATGPGVLDPFLALVDWVENGRAPDKMAAGSGSVANRTRILCPYPQWGRYSGTGSTESAASFACGGNLETPAVVANDTLAPFKHENGN